MSFVLAPMDKRARRVMVSAIEVRQPSSLPLNRLSRREAKEFADLTRDARLAIQLRCIQRKLEQRDLAPFIGSRARVSEVLNGKRSVSISMIRALHLGLAIPLDHLCGIEAGLQKARPE